MDWINTKDKFPEVGQGVEFKYEIICKGTYFPQCRLSQWISDEEPPNPGVIHWRPLDENLQ